MQAGSPERQQPMFDLHTYWLFVATAAVLVLTPGPDTVLILSRTLASGA